jgi:signal transduction histidine kinase
MTRPGAAMATKQRQDRAERGDGRRARRVEDQLAAIMAVSRAVAEATALEDSLTTIARTAARLVGASAAAIILRAHESATGLAVAGQYGLSEEYATDLNRIRPIELGQGPSGLAAERGEPVAVADVLSDPIFGPWRSLAVREHYRAMVSAPLRLGGGRVIGVLNAYRRRKGPWSRDEIDLLVSLADHAATAIRIAQLLDESRHQVRGLSLIVQSLRAQSHEHSNLLHAISGLLAMGELNEARSLIASSEARYHSAYARVTSRIENAAISGFLLAEAVTAGNSGIELKIDRRSRLRTLPQALGELDAITILGNLIRNAVEAVSAVRGPRRRISVFLADGDGELVVRVRDWGRGIPPEQVATIFETGYSTKNEHAGVGLSLVRSIVTRTQGRVEVEQPAGPGVAIAVRIPL